MEDKETPKRTYKKHKEDFKITISYRLNTSLKSHFYGEDDVTVEGGIKLYPLYVEIRVKRQRSYFRSSIWSLVNPSYFDAFIENPIVKSLVEQERESILIDLKKYIAKNEDEFLVNNWLVDFRNKATISNVLVGAFSGKFRELIVERNIDSKPLLELIYNGDSLWSMLNLSLLLTDLDIRIFDPVIEVTEAFYRLREVLKNIKPFEWNAKSTKVQIGVDWSLSIDNLIGNEFVIESIKSSDPRNSKVLLQDLNILTKFIKDFKKNYV